MSAINIIAFDVLQIDTAISDYELNSRIGGKWVYQIYCRFSARIYRNIELRRSSIYDDFDQR